MNNNTLVELREALKEIHTTYTFENMSKDSLFVTLRQFFKKNPSSPGLLLNDLSDDDQFEVPFRIIFKEDSFRVYFNGPSSMSQLRIGKETRIVQVSYSKGQQAQKDKLLVDDFFADVTNIQDHEADLMEMVYPEMAVVVITLHKCISASRELLKNNRRFNGGR